MLLRWQFLIKHEHYIEMLRTFIPKSSNVDHLEFDANGTLVIHSRGESKQAEEYIKEILEIVEKGFQQISAHSISGKKVKCVKRYLDELQRHIDVDSFLENETDSVHIVYDKNKYTHVEKKIDEIASMLQKHANCEFKIFERPACVGRMVQNKHFDVLRTHEGTEVMVQTYGFMVKTIITAIVPHCVCLSPEKVFKSIDVMLQFNSIRFSDLRCKAPEVPLPTKVIEQFLDQKYGDSDVVFWDVVPKYEEIIFCGTEEVNADTIRSSIKTDLVVVVKKNVGECNDDISSLKQKCDIITQHNYVFDVVIMQSREVAQAFDIFVYCHKENKANVEKEVEDMLIGLDFHEVSRQDIESQGSEGQQAVTAGAAENGAAG